MAVHDPESSLQEKQQALKIGRQKKIQIIDGQRVEVMTGKISYNYSKYLNLMHLHNLLIKRNFLNILSCFSI